MGCVNAKPNKSGGKRCHRRGCLRGGDRFGKDKGGKQLLLRWKCPTCRKIIDGGGKCPSDGTVFSSEYVVKA